MTWFYPIAFALLCWYAFAMCVSVYRLWVDGKLSPFNKAVFILPVLFFVILERLLDHRCLAPQTLFCHCRSMWRLGHTHLIQ